MWHFFWKLPSANICEWHRRSRAPYAHSNHCQVGTQGFFLKSTLISVADMLFVMSSLDRNPYTNGNVNLGIAYAVSFMDSQVADYWMYHQDGNNSAAQKCKENAIATSMESSVPCVFTQTVAYETTDAAVHGANDPNASKGERRHFTVDADG